MRDLNISELSIIGGGTTETQCVAAFSSIGWAAGAAIGKSSAAANTGAAVGGIIGGLVCGPLTSSDGDE